MTERIRRATTWRERAAIAQDKLPGTPFDHLFIHARDALQCQTLGKTGNRNRELGILGCWLANVILRGDSTTLKKLALALDAWKWHRPKPDADLIVFCSLMAMFPPGGTKTMLNAKTKRIAPGGVYGPMTIEALMTALNRNFPDHGEKRERYDEAIRKKFKRYAKEFGVRLPDERKSKRKTTGHNPAKKV